MPFHEVDGLNAGYVRVLLEQYLENPEAVQQEWRSFFEGAQEDVVESLPGLRRLAAALAAREDGRGAAPAPAAPAPAVAAPAPVAPAPAAPAPAPALPAPPDPELLAAVAAAMALVDAYRTHGHLAARLDPLGSEPVGDPALEPGNLVPALTPALQARVPSWVLGVSVPGTTLAEALPHLRETYCGTIAYEIEHISSHAERVWLRQAIESGRYRVPLSPEKRRELLARLSDAEGMEHYLRRAFLGQKQFSLEGLDVMVPMLDEALEVGAEAGVRKVVIGMAHRGRLNVLAHTIGVRYHDLLREFEGERTIAAVVMDQEGGTGDVKYHLGAEGVRTTPSGEVEVSVVANPSHLEAVNPVVGGEACAAQTERAAPGPGAHDATAVLPVLIHGDASFAGQGVVAESLNMEALAGYGTGGTLHLIANNQVGFTTDPHESRSTRYSSDLAKGFDIPIVHVNADDPEAALVAVRLALAFRERFRHPVLIDLVGYRRFGHNEQDEPGYTQPQLVAAIEAHPTARALYAERLVAEGVVSQEEADRLAERASVGLKAAHESLKAELAAAGAAVQPDGGSLPPAHGEVAATAVDSGRLRALNEELLRVPDGFSVHPKLARQLERRREAIEEGGIDWAQAEALALGSLVCDGVPVRLTGQDTERGTFSQRHLALHDWQTGERHAPIQHLSGATASFELHNSPLSEFAVLGFEYGYSVAAPEALVVWEAQFGDFLNGAQVVVDQFITPGLAKWGQTSRLTLLLPHGYEGNGPEHSSARLERLLQMCAQDNVRVANCTTAAQYFHLLRRQALAPAPRPLVVLTPKGLLRLRQASSAIEELAGGGFRQVLDDPAADHEATRRLVLCSGKLYYDIVGHEASRGADRIAVARLEQLYPFPVEALGALVRSYPGLREVVWAQEEPQNMGAWRAIRHRLEDSLPAGLPLGYVGRPWRAATSEGYPTAHLVEQDRIVRTVLTPV